MWQFPVSGERDSLNSIIVGAEPSLPGSHSAITPLPAREAKLQEILVYKRPLVALGTAFEPAAVYHEARLRSKVSNDSTRSPIPSCAERKRSGYLEVAVETPDGKEPLYLESDDIEPITLSESSLPSPPLSPQVFEPVKPEEITSSQIPELSLHAPLGHGRPDDRQSSIRYHRRRDPSEILHACNRSTVLLSRQVTLRQVSQRISKPRSKSSSSLQAQNSRACISCNIDRTPCWRPSWDASKGQLCNSCGLRYRKTRIRCGSALCANVPSKLDLAAIRTRCCSDDMRCPKCDARLLQD